MAGVGQSIQRHAQGAQSTQSEHRERGKRRKHGEKTQGCPEHTAAQRRTGSAQGCTGTGRRTQGDTGRTGARGQASASAAPRTGSNNRACMRRCTGAQAGVDNRACTQARTQVHRRAQAPGHARAAGRTHTPTGERGRVWGGEGSRIIEPNLGASYMRTEPESNCMRTSTTRSTRGHLVAPKVVLYQVLIRARAAAT